MNDCFQERIMEYLQKTEDFALREAPQLFSEILDYTYKSNICGLAIFGTLVLIFSILFTYSILNPYFDKYGSREISNIMTIFFSGLIGFYCFIFVLSCVDDLIKITYAPRYFLIQKFIPKK